MKLFQRNKLGHVKFLEIWTEGEFLHTRWGTVGSDAIQHPPPKECEPANVGRANSTTAEEQAIVEMEAKIKKKKDQGYVDDIEKVNETSVVEISLDNIPKEFCPCKPKNKVPKKIEDDPDTYGQRKRDGHCLILVHTAFGVKKVYSRGMEDKTEALINLPVIQEMFSKMTTESMVFTEFCFVNKAGKDVTREAGLIVRKTKPEEVMEAYNNAITRGKVEIIPFDMLFWDSVYWGDSDYKERHETLDAFLTDVPEIIEDWKSVEAKARELDWEGFVLRNDKDSKICYSLNGKADRAGSYKWVFVREDDFVVTSAVKGKAGKQSGMYAQFHLAQYTPNGELTAFGNCGPGKLKHDRLAELTKEIDSGELEFPFTIQVEFKDREPDSGKLKQPQFVEVRYDKKPSECVTDFECE
jgi:ATP-dependent DNA ligase/predicted DNA-binding WGR domain protein